MKICLALVIALTACSHKSDTKTPANGGGGTDDSAMVDPTLPSWAPKTCSSYHTVVVKAVDCPEIDQGTRDSIKAKYETQNTAWHDMQNAPPERITEIGQECKTDHDTVHAQAAGKCGIPADATATSR
jgi:hypothetical protein